MSDLYKSLLKEIDYAKTSVMTQRSLYSVHGKIEMAWQLEAITKDEYFDLNHKCVAEGINNSKYFDR